MEISDLLWHFIIKCVNPILDMKFKHEFSKSSEAHEMCLGGAAYPLSLLGGGASFPRSCWVALLDLLLQWLVPSSG